MDEEEDEVDEEEVNYSEHEYKGTVSPYFLPRIFREALHKLNFDFFENFCEDNLKLNVHKCIVGGGNDSVG